MYNRYISPEGFDIPNPPGEDRIPEAEETLHENEELPPQKKPLLSGISRLFEKAGGEGGLLNQDLFPLLIVIFFLLYDDKDDWGDLLVIIGIMLLLGL